jgi:NOL1/NOP2/fmu family ribosome biogenesis protein
MFKKNNESNGRASNSKNKIDQPSAKEIDVIKKYLKQNAVEYFIKQNEEIIALPQIVFNELGTLQLLYIKKAGVKLGTVIKTELVPHHELALSTLMNNTIPLVSVSLENALQFLRKQEMKIETTFTGWALIQYQNLAIGWVKVLSNRINNYYPANWRILNK